MSNVLGSVATGLIIQEALALVFTQRPILKKISTNFRDLDGSVDKVQKGQSVTSRLFGIPAVSNFGSAAADRADTDVAVTLSNFKQVLHSFTAAEISSTSRDLVRESALPIAIAIANHMVDAIAALWIAGNFANSTIQASGWNYNTLTLAKQNLNGRGAPDMGNRFFACSAAVYKSMLDDTTIVAALNNPANGNAIESGRLPTVASFGIMEYPGIPTTGNMVAFAGNTDSTVLACRPPRDPAELLPGVQFPGNVAYITDPTTGLTVRLDEWIGTDLTANVRVSWIYGVAAGSVTNGQIIKTA